jgi:hypothetical protein
MGSIDRSWANRVSAYDGYSGPKRENIEELGSFLTSFAIRPDAPV